MPNAITPEHWQVGSIINLQDCFVVVKFNLSYIGWLLGRLAQAEVLKQQSSEDGPTLYGITYFDTVPQFYRGEPWSNYDWEPIEPEEIGKVHDDQLARYSATTVTFKPGGELLWDTNLDDCRVETATMCRAELQDIMTCLDQYQPRRRQRRS